MQMTLLQHNSKPGKLCKKEGINIKVQLAKENVPPAGGTLKI
jgi:hypothetical protein